MQQIQRALAGDRQAFASLFEEHKNLVYRTAFLIFGNREDAEDALQEVFVLVHKSLARFDSEKGAFSTWLHRITFNYCLNQHRRRRPNLLTLEDETIHPVGKFPAEQPAERDRIEQAIQQLSDRLKPVVILRYYWELPYAEIAEVLELLLGTVKSRLDLALKTLRKLLDEPTLEMSPTLHVEVCNEM